MRVLSSVVLILRDIWTLSFLRDVLCEFLGTSIFLFSSLSSVLLWPSEQTQEPPGLPDGLYADLSSDLSAGLSTGLLTGLSTSLSAGVSPVFSPAVLPDSASKPHLQCSPPGLRVALAFGTSVGLVGLCLGPASSRGGVHLNPAVTMALAAGLRISPWRATLYVAGQLLGAVCSCCVLLTLLPTHLRDTLALNQVPEGVRPSQAVLVEMVVTFQLVLCFLATSRPKPASPLLGPLLVGLSVTLGHLVAISYTGCGMNPARSFGPALVTLNFTNHWVYWAGPCVGAWLASLLHDLLLHPRWGCPGDWWAEFKELFPKDPQKQPTTLENAA